MARKILLADDSVTAQNMGRKILADAGYEVIAVNNGSAALKKISELKPDLVILDVYMPGYSGLEVCQRLKESQETSRIPVLLSVGKLEPFKPEEAQRVRADGFIVKPFEASELLSALSKLEDKVVPRAEPSKPGRFARAIAAAEESGRTGRNEPSGEETGWKSRIGFPKQKTEADENPEDETPIEKPVKQEIRAAEAPAPEKNRRKGDKAKKEDSRQPAAEASVDVAAMAPAGLPKDVTPEEVAAIAAAAAQIQMAGALIHQEQPASEITSSDKVAEVPGDFAAPVNQAPLNQETKTEAPAEQQQTSSKPESKIDLESRPAAAAEPDHSRRGDEISEQGSEEPEDLPVTMASTADFAVSASTGASRWTAVPVALGSEEAAISLDQEMQKAYAAFAPVEPALASLPEPEPTPALNSSSTAPTASDAAAAPLVNPQPESIPQPSQEVSVSTESAPTLAAEPVAAGSSFAAPDFKAPEQFSSAQASSSFTTQPEPAAVSPVDPAPFSPPSSFTPDFATPEPVADPAPVVEPASPVVASAAQESQPSPEAQSVAPAADVQPAAEPTPEPKFASEEVKNTAAAWASWRQTRDTGKDEDKKDEADSEAAQARSGAFEASEPAPAETAARAAAAGAEQILQEAAAASPSGNPKDVASIVDSVLAGLRPKLMEEISRKMSEKK